MPINKITQEKIRRQGKKKILVNDDDIKACIEPDAICQFSACLTKEIVMITYSGNNTWDISQKTPTRKVVSKEFPKAIVPKKNIM